MITFEYEGTKYQLRFSYENVDVSYPQTWKDGDGTKISGISTVKRPQTSLELWVAGEYSYGTGVYSVRPRFNKDPNLCDVHDCGMGRLQALKKILRILGVTRPFRTAAWKAFWNAENCVNDPLFQQISASMPQPSGSTE